MNLKDYFPLPLHEQWLKIVQKELKDITYDSLFFKNVDGIKIAPIHHHHQDYEQPIKTQFPELVSYWNFPFSKVGLSYNLINHKNHSFEMVFLSLPFELAIQSKSEHYLLINDFFEPSKFLNLIPHFPELSTKYKGIVLDISYLQECGANNIDSISFALFLLEKIPRNIPIIIKVSIANDFYSEIAKMRALNFILQNFGFYNVKIWAKTAEINKSLLHLENNLIRLTSEVVAAVLGGSHYISIIPFDLNFDDEFGIRISANILNLLKFESYLDKVSDPLRGAYSIEKLTNSYTSQFFQQLLFWKSLNPSNLFQQIQNQAHNNLKKILLKYQNKENLLVGVNIYPNQLETREEEKIDYFPETLRPVRIAQLL